MKSTPETALGAAMSRAGLNTTELRLRSIAADALRKHHRNIPRALDTFERSVEDDPELIREALLQYLCRFDADMSFPGQNSGDNRPPPAGAGHTVARGVGQQADGPRNQFARPAREPSPAHRAAAAAVARSVAITVLDTFMVRDGRAIGDVRYGELQRMMSTNAVEAAVIRQILDHGKAAHDARVRDVVKVDDLQKFIQRAAEIVDAA
jgi:hypothetical protein